MGDQSRVPTDDDVPILIADGVSGAVAMNCCEWWDAVAPAGIRRILDFVGGWGYLLKAISRWSRPTDLNPVVAIGARFSLTSMPADDLEPARTHLPRGDGRGSTS
jgi:hypothetical protein